MRIGWAAIFYPIFFMRFVSLFLGALALLATALPLIKTPLWWIRVFDYPRAQIAVLCMVSILLALRFSFFSKPYKEIWLIALAVAFVYQMSYVFIYTPLYPVQAKASNKVKQKDVFSLMISNVRMDNTEAAKFVALVHKYQPDILLVNEPNNWWAQQLEPLAADYPHKVLYPLENTYGMMLFSKLPLLDEKVRFLIEKEVPSIIATVQLPSGNTFDLYCVHPKPPMPDQNTDERDAEILLVGKEAKLKQRPAIVTGDLNDVAWSHTSRLFQRYTGMVDPREGRGLYNTYSVFVPLFRYPLDHIFYTADFGLTSIQRLERFGSDHFPMFVKLTFEPGENYVERKPQAEPGDVEEAEEKIEEGKEKAREHEEE